MIFSFEIKNLDTYLLKEMVDKIDYINPEVVLSMEKKGVGKIWVYQYENKEKVDIIAFSMNKNPDKIIYVMDIDTIMNDCMNFDLSSNNRRVKLKEIENLEKDDLSFKLYDITNENVNGDNSVDDDNNDDIILDVDSILDKISKKGLGGISKQELDFLEKQK